MRTQASGTRAHDALTFHDQVYQLGLEHTGTRDPSVMPMLGNVAMAHLCRGGDMQQHYEKRTVSPQDGKSTHGQSRDRCTAGSCTFAWEVLTDASCPGVSTHRHLSLSGVPQILHKMYGLIGLFKACLLTPTSKTVLELASVFRLFMLGGMKS